MNTLSSVKFNVDNQSSHFYEREGPVRRSSISEEKLVDHVNGHLTIYSLIKYASLLLDIFFLHPYSILDLVSWHLKIAPFMDLVPFLMMDPGLDLALEAMLIFGMMSKHLLHHWNLWDWKRYDIQKHKLSHINLYLKGRLCWYLLY